VVAEKGYAAATVAGVVTALLELLPALEDTLVHAPAAPPEGAATLDHPRSH
jgi:hypothetical protein